MDTVLITDFFEGFTIDMLLGAFSDLLLRKGGAMMFLAALSDLQAGSNGVLHVLCRGYPLQIARVVVCLDPVFVVYFWLTF